MILTTQKTPCYNKPCFKMENNASTSSRFSTTTINKTISIYSGMSKFIVEYTLLFLYIYSFVLVQIKNLATVGWNLLLGTHFISTVNALLKTYPRIGEPIVSVIIACFILVLVGVFYIAMGIFKVQQSQISVNMAVPPILEGKLQGIFPFLVADIVLLYVVLFAFKTQIFSHIFPFYVVPSNKQAGKFSVEMIRLRDYPTLTNYLLIWIIGGCQIAVLGLSPYIVFLTNAFYVETQGLF